MVLVWRLLVLTACLCVLDPSLALAQSDAEQAEGPGDEAESSESQSAAEESRTVEREAIRSSLSQVIDKSTPVFCTTGKFELKVSERRFCVLSDAIKARCPGLEEACQSAAHDESRSRRRSSSDRAEMRLPAVLSTAAALLFWGILAVAVAALLVVVIRKVFAERAGRALDGDRGVVQLEVEPHDGAQPVSQSETDADRLLARATEAAAKGDYRQATTHAHAALLRYLDQRGLIFVHRSKTNGDYLRSLSGDAGLHASFRWIAREVERVQFGSDTPTASSFEHVLSRIRPLLDAALVLLIALASSFLLSACGGTGDLGSRSLGGEDGPAGHSLLSQLLEARGVPVRHRIRRIDNIGDDVYVIVLFANPLTETEWSVLEQWTESGGLLVLAVQDTPIGKRLKVEPDPRRCSGPLHYDNGGEGLKLHTVENASLRVGSDSSAWVTLHCGESEEEPSANLIVAANLGDGVVVFVPSPATFANATLLAGDNALIADDLLNYGGAVELVGDWTGKGADSPLAALSGAGLGPWVLQLLVLCAVFLWSRGIRFGSPVADRYAQRQSFLQHVIALSKLYAKAGARNRVLASYGEWAIERLRERTVPGSRGGLSRIAEAIASKTGRSEAEVMITLVQAHSAAQESDQEEGSKEAVLETFGALRAYLKDIGGK